MYGHEGDMKIDLLSGCVFKRTSSNAFSVSLEWTERDAHQKSAAHVFTRPAVFSAFSQCRGHSLLPSTLTHLKTRLCLPHISLLYSPLKPSYSSFGHHESQCLELAPICHLIIVPWCRDPSILPCLSESCNTFPNFLGNSTRKCQWHFGGPGEC
jgi:hypothetical protein